MAVPPDQVRARDRVSGDSLVRGGLPEGSHRATVVLAVLAARPRTLPDLARALAAHHPGHPLTSSRGGFPALRAVLTGLAARGLATHSRDYHAARGTGPAYRTTYTITAAGQSTLASIRDFYSSTPEEAEIP